MNELILSNVVVIAENLNPSIFRETWLVKEGIFTEDEIGPESFFSSVSVNVLTPSIELLVVPDRLQLILKTSERQDETIKKILGTVVAELPHTPYKALGFNFHWVFTPLDQSKFPKVTQEMFLSEKNPLRNIFNTEDARFGIYLSKDELDMRLKLDVKPIKGAGENIGKEALKFHFNFDKHINNPEKTTEIILETIDKWSAAKKASENIIQEMSKSANFN
ncbi:MAG: hypothetical protein K8F52_04970 [Candidatus Scalindua rubra]|uniref:Uncharacterized protein n=1 Tax=Candidatus Scalindua brodae TaxID=237368 RepID=A0A0B0ELL3_9BACT|nr:MAG: hypothetical protein SCABRO_00316 [Candidatus Scalindua brodae]MBZ0107999.1 hypothetical protein [Candidatus Scalindua rubra]TWU28771.1 hypothetical protein S225a_27980 [Candidatus Brocadiaceae bacterium S225]